MSDHAADDLPRQRTPGDRRPPTPTRPDPDAPGNYVDDDSATEVPEPNEPG